MSDPISERRIQAIARGIFERGSIQDDEAWDAAMAEARASYTPVPPMTGLRLACRVAKGGPLSTDGPDELEAFDRAMATRPSESEKR